MTERSEKFRRNSILAFAAEHPFETADIPDADLVEFLNDLRPGSEDEVYDDDVPVCKSCDTDIDVTFGPDPYAEEIHLDSTPVWECEGCRHESAQDI